MRGCDEHMHMYTPYNRLFKSHILKMIEIPDLPVCMWPLSYDTYSGSGQRGTM